MWRGLRPRRRRRRGPGFASNEQRVAAVRAMATALRDAEPTILEQNGLDMDAAAKAGTSAGLLDRLELTHERIEDGSRPRETRRTSRPGGSRA